MEDRDKRAFTSSFDLFGSRWKPFGGERLEQINWYLHRIDSYCGEKVVSLPAITDIAVDVNKMQLPCKVI